MAETATTQTPLIVDDAVNAEEAGTTTGAGGGEEVGISGAGAGASIGSGAGAGAGIGAGTGAGTGIGAITGVGTGAGTTGAMLGAGGVTDGEGDDDPPPPGMTTSLPATPLGLHTWHPSKARKTSVTSTGLASCRATSSDHHCGISVGTCSG